MPPVVSPEAVVRQSITTCAAAARVPDSSKPSLFMSLTSAVMVWPNRP